LVNKNGAKNQGIGAKNQPNEINGLSQMEDSFKF
jgi:hypothetical protein